MFTPQARVVVWLAREEALRLGAARVEPEHILLGLAGSGGVAQLVLSRAGLTTPPVAPLLTGPLPVPRRVARGAPPHAGSRFGSGCFRRPPGSAGGRSERWSSPCGSRCDCSTTTSGWHISCSASSISSMLLQRRADWISGTRGNCASKPSARSAAVRSTRRRQPPTTLVAPALVGRRALRVWVVSSPRAVRMVT